MIKAKWIKEAKKKYWNADQGESGRARATDCNPATRNPKEGEGAEEALRQKGWEAENKVVKAMKTNI